MPRHSGIVGSTAGPKIALCQKVQHYNLIETNLIYLEFSKSAQCGVGEGWKRSVDPIM